MNVLCIAVFCIILIVDVDAASLKQSASIQNDAKELSELLVKIWSMKPAILKRVFPAVSCELIDKCCKAENRAKATALMSQEEEIFNYGMPERIIEMCVNSSPASKIDRTCSAVIKSRVSHQAAENDSAVEEYLNIISTVGGQEIMLFRWIRRSCEAKHVQAFLCLSNRELVEECANKVLGMASDDNYIDYAAMMMSAKQTFLNIIEKLSKKFPKNPNDE